MTKPTIFSCTLEHPSIAFCMLISKLVSGKIKTASKQGRGRLRSTCTTKLVFCYIKLDRLKKVVMRNKKSKKADVWLLASS
ncbi:hypothetical protein O6P43_017956 [Quillaja saponaria]|uniref:Uncharacterized protein n=1 Tax=Quillaja saponaria TaxID=32244 RepID=A0AAD7PQ55_QUISA|nr:hypothetical protein O6P43_017956 [Quillaja saponaria]